MGVSLSKQGHKRHSSVTPVKADLSLSKASQQDGKKDKPPQKIENPSSEAKQNHIQEDKINEKSPKIQKINSKAPSPV